jgi:lipoprotein-releasing system ATP-binding protein
MSDIVLNCKSLNKSYSSVESKDSVSTQKQKLEILKDVNLEIKSGEQIAIIGSSGSGKTTLLNTLAGIDRPTSGDIYLDNKPLLKLSEREQANIRNHFFGFIYQFHHLLPELSAQENVMMPLLISGMSKKDARDKSKEILTQVNLQDRLNHKPGLLSGGEKQRVAIARALVMNPKVVFADEPTGNLDQKTAKQVIDLLKDLNKKFKTCLIIVTHDLQIAKDMDRVFEMQSGGLVLTSSPP